MENEQIRNRSFMNQCKIVFQKNFLLYLREKQVYGDFLPPLICFIMLYIAKSSSDIAVSQSSAQFLPMSLLLLTRNVITAMISEKSERQKETQKIMGLKPNSYSFGWILTNYVRLFAVSFFFLILVVPTGVMKTNEINKNSLTMSETIISFGMYGLAQLQLCYLIAAIFETPKTGADLAVVINVFGSIGSQLLTIEYIQKHSYVVYILSLIPSFCYNVYPYVSITGVVEFDFGKKEYFGVLLFDIIFYGLLAQYLDQVVPNEYGTNKHPLFFLGVKYENQKKKKKNQVQNYYVEPLNEDLQDGQDESSAIFHEQMKNKIQKAVQIEDLKRYFGETKAVDGLTLSIYESQILCLLGHNGAGKTTAISLLTGLIKKDYGQIKYYGISTDDDLDGIRSFLGICPQKDVLYNKMTVIEHLMYYGKIKGLDGQNLENQIEEVIEKCALTQEKTKQANQLSGGNKRKLCLAMALIGGSKVIFLDEPTSGMDPVTRRKIWNILLQMKNEGKCLILTTHHLDEAEVLSERIAIMAKGKLLTVGSVDFVKKNFGIGYHLNIYNLKNSLEIWEDKVEKIKSLIMNQIKDARIEPQTANLCISFSVPFDSKSSLLNIFEILENDQSIQINLLMNTLEEAFINIGMDEEAFLKKAQNNITVLSNNQSDQDINLNDEFAKIIPPNCLGNDPTYSFTLQFKACFLRKLYGMKGKRLAVQLFFSSLFCFLGPLLGSLTSSTIKPIDDNDDLKSYYLREYIISFTIYLCAFIELIMAMSISSTSIGSVPVQERQQKQKYALNVMGCRIEPYWISNFAFDSCVVTILFAVYSITTLLLQVEQLNYFVVYALFFFCFITYVALSYLLSWLFTEFLSSLKYMMLLMVFIFYMPGMICYFVIKEKFIKWILCFLFPSVSLLSGLTAVLDLNYNPSIIEVPNFFIEQPWVFVCILIFQTLLYLILAILIDHRKLLSVNQQPIIVESKDGDVIQEAKRVQSESCQDRVIARRISKVYANGFQALKGTSFGVESGQIFGLLGPNGAGKSTTFNMITCRLKPTTGEIKLMGQLIEKGKGELFQNVGICPQFDSLFEMITVKQHLFIWAYLKGLNGIEAIQSVEYFMKVMQLDAYENVHSDKLSGGNKRKLCVALALMGGTNMQFFDEPSSGVDPIARRFLWNAIQNGVKLRNGAVILTTHTMDEAENLCSKIAIQINGQFSCIGTPQHLKQKFGDGYRVSLELEENVQSQQVIKLVKQEYPNCDILEENNYKVVVQLQKQGFSFFNSFSFFLEIIQNQYKYIKDFQLNQATLESVFMYFAGQQEIIEQDEIKKKKCVIACCGNDEDD
ncbi:unnamed protein product [Paramecium primaurelia]|uniref:ABC transporter domain-containing protein n=1 Tax=Paramecium primaurelia TaxID=5886 RepID=A0A8S1PIN0_PARPR|nr:unnamed protein product [Paramecium primaurelia]